MVALACEICGRLLSLIPLLGSRLVLPILDGSEAEECDESKPNGEDCDLNYDVIHCVPYL